MRVLSNSISNRIMYAHGIGISGKLYTNEGDISYGIRPVITISKTTLS